MSINQFAGKVAEHRYRLINRYLLEGLFFHRQDNPELFEVLYRQREAFQEAWQDFFGMRIVVQRDVAYRVHDNPPTDVDGGFANDRIHGAGRDHFYWSPDGKLHLLIFARFLYYYATEVRRQAEAPHGEHPFVNMEFWSWVNGQLDEFFASRPELRKSGGPASADKVHAAFRTVMADLERFGFIRRVEQRELTEADRQIFTAGDHLVKYHARPGLLAFDAKVLHEQPGSFRAAFRLEEAQG